MDEKSANNTVVQILIVAMCSSVASPKFWEGPNIERSNSILFVTTLLKAQKDKKFWGENC